MPHVWFELGNPLLGTGTLAYFHVPARGLQGSIGGTKSPSMLDKAHQQNHSVSLDEIVRVMSPQNQVGCGW